MSGKEQSTSYDGPGASSRHVMRYAPRHDQSQAGAENQDSPRSDTAASPLVTRREFTTHVAVTHVPPPQSQYTHGFALGPPPGTKMLVDPQTGQHYLVPTAQPPVAYYPVFYNPSQPPPPPSQPVYYQPTSAPGYLVASSLSSPPPNAHQPIFFHQPPPSTAAHFTSTTTTETRIPQDFSASFGSGQKPISGGYRVEIPPSAAPTPMNDMQSGSPSRYFQRDHQYRVSTESAGSARSQRNFSDDSASPLPHVENSTPPCFNRMTAEQSSARYSTTSSSTSGFASGAGESTAEISPMRRPCVRLQPRNPLYGAPAWWGDASPTDERRPDLGEHEDRTPTDSARDVRLSPPKTASPQLDRSSPPELSDSPPRRPITSHQMTAEGGQKVVQKSIRMDIDLSRPLSPEEKEKVCVKATVSRAPPTAFTVSFDDEGLKELKKANAVSLQDAARKAPTGRRLMRRSEPSKQSGKDVNVGDSGSESGQDPKHYLLNKMLQGYRRSGPSHSGNHSAPVLETAARDEKPEIDTLSEAGTYVVDEKDRKSNVMVTSQTYAEDFDSDTESSSTETSSSTATRSPPPSSSAPSSARNPTQVAAQSSPKRSLMSDLQRLRAQNATKPSPPQQRPQAQPRRTGPPVWRNPSAEPRPGRPAGSGQPPSAGRMCQQRPATSSNAASSNNNSFRRGDGGRFSMRGGSAAASKPPPFRPLGVSASAKGPPRQTFGNAPQKDSPEMTAWLRRKEYDPRKAAAESRKMQQFKDRANAYTSARSVTFHGGNGAASPFRSLRHMDERSNKSHDDLSRLGEEPEELSHAGSTASLTKTVDELTVKCQKSIQLLKLCNQNSLSASVENLLRRVMNPESAAVDAPTSSMGSVDGLSDNLSDRLEKLNSAFDAIQKYLEEQSGNSTPPMPHKLLAGAVRPRVASASAATPQSPSTPTAANTNDLTGARDTSM